LIDSLLGALTVILVILRRGFYLTNPYTNLPHPLMGRMTIRAIVAWTVYHTEHHYKILQSNY